MEAVLPKIMDKVTKTLNKNIEKYVWMKLFLEYESLLKMNFFLDIFQRFRLSFSGLFSQNTSLYTVFVIIVHRLCTVIPELC